MVSPLACLTLKYSNRREQSLRQWHANATPLHPIGSQCWRQAIIAMSRQAAPLDSYLEHTSATYSHVWKMEGHYQRNYKTQ